MNKELKETLMKRASVFQDSVMKDLIEQGASFTEKNLILAKLQSALSEFFEPFDVDIAIVSPFNKPTSKDNQNEEKKALIRKLKKIIEENNLSYNAASNILEIPAGPLNNWLNEKTLPSRMSFIKLKERIKRFAPTRMKKEESEDENQESEIR